MKKFVHWVFDLDGTIIDSSQNYEDSIHEILREFSITPTDNDIQRAFQYFEPHEYFATFFSETPKIERCVQRLVELNLSTADAIPAFPGIEKLLQFLQSHGVHISIWTGRETESSERILKALGFRKYLHSCVGRTCVERTKPYPDGLLKILKDSKHHGDDVVMIGDHEYDMRGALEAKVKGVSVGWDRRAHSNAKKLSQMHFNRVDELLNWAKSLYEPVQI